MKRVNIYAAIREMREQVVKTMQERGITELAMCLSPEEWAKETGNEYEPDETGYDEDYDTYVSDESPYVIFFDKYNDGSDERVENVRLKVNGLGVAVLEFDCIEDESGQRSTFDENDLVFLTLFNVYDRMYDLLEIEDTPDAHTLTVPYAVGDKIKWRCDDDGKVRTSKVFRVECEIDKSGSAFTYYVRTKWKGQMTVAGVTHADIIND